MGRTNWSFYICWGENAGFRIETTKRVKRLVLWKFAVAFIKQDIEQLIDYALRIVERNQGRKNE